MAKDTFYFSHDLSARNDPKLRKVLRIHGVAGIGLYWCLVEMLYEQGGYLKQENYDDIAWECHVELRMLESIVHEFGLFMVDETSFWSESILMRMKLREEKRLARAQAGSIGGRRKAENIAIDKQTSSIATNLTEQNGSNALAKPKQGKERKVKEIKGKVFSAPTIQEVVAYFTENGYSDASAQKAFNYYDTAEWKDSKGNAVKNWKQKMIAVWFKDENKAASAKPQTVTFKNGQTGQSGTMPLEQWQRAHANNPDSPLKYLSNA